MHGHRRLLGTGIGALAVCLSACGGGGGGERVDVIPTPPATPAPPETPEGIIGAIAAGAPSQDFAVAGTAFHVPGNSQVVEGPFTGTSGELKVRYDGASASYEIQLPGDSTWSALLRKDGQFYETAGNEFTGVTIHESAATGYSYSALADWAKDSTGQSGDIAFGIPTPAGAVPTTGTANYAGTILGQSTAFSEFANGPVAIGGTVSLVFDFAGGTLSGNINAWDASFEGGPAIGTLAFTDTVYSTGSATFSGRFDTPLAGPNAFSGLFTGPHAQELIGSFVFPYGPPEQPYIASGSWVAKH